jgi:hypothetical protein
MFRDAGLARKGLRLWICPIDDYLLKTPSAKHRAGFPGSNRYKSTMYYVRRSREDAAKLSPAACSCLLHNNES